MRDIPILIGGQGERKTLKLVAQYAQMWHGFTTPQTYPDKAAVLDRHCADVGRDPATIERSAGVENNSGVRRGEGLDGVDRQCRSAYRAGCFTTDRGRQRSGLRSERRARRCAAGAITADVRSFLRAAVALLVALMIGTMCPAVPARAKVDQCAPPGVAERQRTAHQSGGRRQGHGEDRYTTAGVQPLSSVHPDALGLGTPGVLTVGTLSDAPPSICIDSAGQFTGFDNELLRAIADKLGLKINFVGTDFSGLLAQVASRRFDVGSSSITTTDARRRTVGFTNGYDFGYFSLVVPTGSSITGFGAAEAGPAHRRRAGHRAGGLRHRHPAPGPGEVSRLQHGVRQPEDPARSTPGWRRRSRRRAPSTPAIPRGSSKTPSAWTISSPTRWPRRTGR